MNKCKCSHSKEVHNPKDLGGCCAMWRGKDENIKCCSCSEFEEISSQNPEVKS